MLTPALLLLTAFGCSPGKSGGEAYFDDFACSAEPWDWYSDPVQAVLEADEDGDFDYNPDGELITDREGTYDFESGDLEWSNRYLDESYLVAGYLEGYGTVYDNGDSDLLYRSGTQDVLGDETHSRVRLQREDCEATLEAWDIDADDDLDATPSEDPFTWEIVIVSDDRVESTAEFDDGGSEAVYERVQTSDMVTVTSFELDDGDTAFGETTAYGDGTASATQTQYGDEVDWTSEIEYFVDGSRTIRQEGTLSGNGDEYAECDYSVDYEGNGGGECTFLIDGQTLDCDMDISPSDCVLDCGSDGTYDC